MVVLRFDMNTGLGWKTRNPPLNWPGLQLEALFNSQHPSASIRSTNLEWLAEEAKELYAYRKRGLTGQGAGIFEMPGLRINGCNEILLDGGIDLTNESTLWECDKVTAPLRESAKLDYLMDNAEGFSFATLKGLPTGTPGRILDTDYKFIPYCLSEIPDRTQIMMLSISLFIMTKELITLVKDITQMIQEFIGRITAGALTLGLTLIMVVVFLLEIIAYFVYFVLLLVAIIKMLKQLFDNIFQKKKWKLGMTVRDCFKRGAEYLGLQFSSTFLTDPTSKYYNTTIMPSKRVMPDYTNNLLTGIFDRPEDENVLNGKVYGYPDGNFAQFIRDMMQVFNAEPVVKNGVLYFERRNFWNNQVPYQIPITSEPGFTWNLPDPHGTNAHEVVAYYALFYQLDETDRNTLNRYRGTSVAVNIVPNIIYNQKNVVLKGSKIETFAYAYARRKETFTPVEDFLNDVVQQVFGFASGTTGQILSTLANQISSALSVVSGSNPGSLTIDLSQAPNIINDRIGWLNLSQDSTGVPKIFVGAEVSPFKLPTFGKDWEVHPFNESLANGSPGYMNAVTLLNEFHGENLATRGNQWLIYKNRKIKFCCEDWQKVKGNNILKTVDGKNGKFEKILWTLEAGEANVDFRIRENYTNNLKEMISVDGQTAT